jgi:Lrp/AsnC family leucine-responsive transcriptional regulator
LSEQVHLSPLPCLRRVRAVEDSGVIRGYTAIIDEEAIGLAVIAFVRVRLALHKKGKMDAVMDCYLITGDAEYLLRVVVRSLKEYERFVRERINVVPGIASIETSFAYGQVKRSTILTLEDGV